MVIKWRKDNMRHYFVDRKHDEEDYFVFQETFQGVNFSFKSCSDVFSKNELDYGSLVLVRSVLEHSNIFDGGKIMDMCCGYGTIGILLSKFLDVEFYMSDVNSTAVELAKTNVINNKTYIKPENIFVSNLFDNVNLSFNHIVSNPPIKVGKKILWSFVDGSYEHLETNGTLTLVIKKNLGEDSLRKYLISKFGNCDIWERDKGYYILHCIKNN